MGVRLDELRTKRANLAMEQARADLHSLLALPSFGRFLERLAFTTGLFGSSFGPDVEHMAYVAGKRDVARAVLKDCADVHPGAVAKLASDHFLRLQGEQAEDAKAAAADVAG